MIVITLSHVKQYEYLRHVFDSYARNGMPIEELTIAADVWARIVGAQDIPIQTELGHASSMEMRPDGVVLDFDSRA